MLHGTQIIQSRDPVSALEHSIHPGHHSKPSILPLLLHTSFPLLNSHALLPQHIPVPQCPPQPLSISTPRYLLRFMLIPLCRSLQRLNPTSQSPSRNLPSCISAYNRTIMEKLHTNPNEERQVPSKRARAPDLGRQDHIAQGHKTERSNPAEARDIINLRVSFKSSKICP